MLGLGCGQDTHQLAMEPRKDKREIKSDITCTSLFSGNVVAGHHDSHHHHHLPGPGLPR